jgi:hypothetical protein
MPARHTSPQNRFASQKQIPTGGSGRRKRVSARHQVKRLDGISQRVRSFRKPVRQKKQVFFVRCGSLRSAISPAKAQVKSGPDVFADALVLSEPQPMRRSAPVSPLPRLVLSVHGSRPGRGGIAAPAADSRSWPDTRRARNVARMVIVVRNRTVNQIPRIRENPVKQ